MGFIKSTDHLPTGYRPTDPPTTDPPTSDQPTHQRNNYQPTDKIMFKRLENMKTFILQNENTAGKMENYTSAYYLFEPGQSL